ncbi:MAG: class I SAM-dependent methyltransferase [Anaerolineales bacterium]|nr:class I SAM-dependent methyltransferase [Anaerolineales bacterium]
MSTQSHQRSERLYHDLAYLWPVISPPEEYIAEALQFVDLFRRYGLSSGQQPGDISPRPLSLLHLGCGGGHLDLTLKKYFTLLGVDLSPEMLRLARTLNPEILYLEGDMRAIRLDQRFDAVLIADSVDYMLDEADLGSAFQTAWAHLRPGGVFITYAEETQERFENNRTESSTHAQGSLEITLIENLYDPDPADSTYEMTFVYLIRSAGKLAIEFDRHFAGIFPLATWTRLLAKTGFSVQVIEPEDETMPFLIAQKPFDSAL